MAKGCCAIFCKFCCIVINIALFAAGGALLTMSAMGYASSDLSNKIQDAVNKVPAFAITNAESVRTFYIVGMAVGIFLVLLGFFGCFGAAFESGCLLGSYVSILITIITLEIGTIIFLYAFKKDAQHSIRTVILKAAKYTSGQEKDDAGLRGACALFKALDESVRCCGATGQQNNVKQCVNVDPKAKGWQCLHESVGKPCPDAVLEKIYGMSWKVAAALGGICVVEVIGVLLALILICTVTSR